MRYIRVRLIRKLAEKLNGVDLSSRAVGDIFELPEPAAALLIAAEWAIQLAPDPAQGGDPHS